ncbi:hypothetical protein [Arcobacter sp. LA11]|uniref:hypothetical protein n=1 Tax=Arcobacter sp. LA11 TaxID=1898176 RepID=UPI0009350E86|nr:hypothetical protein [Arcobacter sp. LA11]
MTLTAYTQNLQYQRTQLQYEAKITPIANASTKLEEDIPEKSNNNIINAPFVYVNESNLSSTEYLQKMIMQKILGAFDSNNEAMPLFPNENADISKESYQKGNPYNEDANNLPQGFMYSSSYEYYEKTTIEFNAEAIIKTPNGEYKIELNFSYTQEFYEKNEIQIAIANETFKNPFEIELEEDDDDSLKDLKSLHFIFDLFKEEDKEEEKDIFEQIKEALRQRREMMLDLFSKDEKENNVIEEQTSKLDNFQVWQESQNSQFQLVAAQKDGIGVFLANSSQESSYMNLSVNSNGYSLSSGYSHSETSILGVTTEIKA